ncbi:hypothetical protein [Larsenimonas rhizosphaerae]|uniref:hypothetical protein n=1 Tax=Larsenimonas rhizosphaerae TaxID=2944682 RepID=UPI0020347F42|nr:hypothetical protein [Larsenimonas rhizosphaerae]MCM2130614.1 hypothetical protein [Larsenimonas rhizosphaerae]
MNTSNVCCPECGCSLDWPTLTSHTPASRWLYCPNNHPLCTVGEFRQVARELALSEEIALYQQGRERRMRAMSYRDVA